MFDMCSLARAAWYSCNLSSAVPFLPASSSSNEMQTVKKLGLCIRKCPDFVLLSASQEAGGKGEGRGSEWRKQTEGLPTVLPVRWAIFGGGCFLLLPPCLLELLVEQTPWELAWETPSGFSKQGPEPRQQLKSLEYTENFVT